MENSPLNAGWNLLYKNFIKTITHSLHVDRRFVAENFGRRIKKFVMKPLVFQGYRFLRQRLLLSILSGRPIKIEKIRSDQSEPGLKGCPSRLIY